MKRIPILLFFTIFFNKVDAQHSVARRWNEQLLHAISGDFARPPVHARNLFHISAAMYDAWAACDPTADTYFLGKNLNGFEIPYFPIAPPKNLQKWREEAISFTAFRLILHRYKMSPGFDTLETNITNLMINLGFDPADTSTNYRCCASGLGNYLAKKVIEYGLQDGSNESGNYANQYYSPVNPPMLPELPGTPFVDLNRWQPMKFLTFIDQSGNTFNNFTTKFQSAEWGNVRPFSLENPKEIYRDGSFWRVFHDPGPPPKLDTTTATAESDEFKWGMALVSIWGSLLDPEDGTEIDISPGSLGNLTEFPQNLAEYHDFYRLFEGGDIGTGHVQNPKTGLPYAPQIVYRGDFYRVLAEFWADGPLSVTPPGHWFEILNYVNDQPQSTRQFRGTGPVLDPLEWDVKSYFALGGAMHDAAIAAWSIKGAYDGTRPITAIRGMAALGQSSDPTKPRFHVGGLPLIPGFIELVENGDPLQGNNWQNVHKIKLRTWRGPKFITNSQTQFAGSGWILAENWYPYQRPTFVTPPFAGYVSGHSTYSRAAAELLTEMTGDPYFPGGMGTFFCKKNEFLVFEDGPSTDITLQWATYRDASDQCSLSRIFGGIHPPMDDIPGRVLGQKIGPDALRFAEKYFTKNNPDLPTAEFAVFPNPTNCLVQIELKNQKNVQIEAFSADGKLILSQKSDFTFGRAAVDFTDFPAGIYFLKGKNDAGELVFQQKVIRQF